MINHEMEFRKKINKFKTCESCSSVDTELKPIGITYTTQKNVDDVEDGVWKKELGKLPILEEALLLASEVQILCNHCKVAYRLHDKTLIPIFQQPTLKTRYDSRISKVIDHELESRKFP